jgi:hypothetical protein
MSPASSVREIEVIANCYVASCDAVHQLKGNVEALIFGKMGKRTWTFFDVACPPYH